MGVAGRSLLYGVRAFTCTRMAGTNARCIQIISLDFGLWGWFLYDL